MKTEEEIINEINITQNKIQSELQQYSENLNHKLITAEIHWDNHIRLMGYRDGLEWTLKEREK